MAFTYGFYNSVAGDRKYNAEQMSEIFDGILRDGVIPSIGQIFAVTTANNGMQINIGSGRAWFNHTWSKNDSVMVLTVPRSDITRPRYDAVVLEVNHSRNVRANSIKIISGDPLVNPTKPALVNTDLIHQYPLAYILVRAATDKINASDIENMVGRSPTVFATGVLESVSIDHLWDQWKGEFNEWFDEIKLILSDDVVTNLQYQIDQLNAKVPAKATSSEAIAGTNNTKYVTPYTAKALIDAEKDTIKDQNGVEYGVATQNIITASQSSTALIGSVTKVYSQGDTGIDVGDYIIRSWNYSYHIIQKSNMNVYVAPSVTNSYIFIAKGENNKVYYKRANDSNLYYGAVTRSGLSYRQTIGTVSNNSTVKYNDEYVIFYDRENGKLFSVTIRTNKLLTSLLPAEASNTLFKGLLLVENYLFCYYTDKGDETGTLKYTRIDVTTGAAINSSFVVGSPDPIGLVYTFSDNILNIGILIITISSLTSCVLVDKDGLITLREFSLDQTLDFSKAIFDATDRTILCDTLIIKYASDTITAVRMSFPFDTKVSSAKPIAIVPKNGYIYDFAGNVYTALINPSFSKITPLHIPTTHWHVADSSTGHVPIYNDPVLLSIYEQQGIYNIIIASSINYDTPGDIKYLLGQYYKLTIDTHPIVSIKAP